LVPAGGVVVDEMRPRRHHLHPFELGPDREHLQKNNMKQAEAKSPSNCLTHARTALGRLLPGESHRLGCRFRRGCAGERRARGAWIPSAPAPSPPRGPSAQQRRRSPCLYGWSGAASERGLEVPDGGAVAEPDGRGPGVEETTGARAGVADYSPPTRGERNRRLAGGRISLSPPAPPDGTRGAAGTAG
jgi:hypothetical protein